MPAATSDPPHAPLGGWRVLVPRAAHQAEALAQPLRDLGAEPICLPVLRLLPPSDPEPLRRAVRSLRGGPRPNWILFTSRNGVDAFFDALGQARLDARSLAGVGLGAIGTATAEALARRELLADLIPPRFVGEAVAEALLQALAERGEAPERMTIWLPRAEVAREALLEALRTAGMRVSVLPAYRIEGPDAPTAHRLRSLFEQAPPRAVCFTSPSTVRFLCQALGPDAERTLRHSVRAAIGPITAEALRRAGLPPHLEAEPHTAEALAHALARDAHALPEPVSHEEQP